MEITTAREVTAAPLGFWMAVAAGFIVACGYWISVCSSNGLLAGLPVYVWVIRK